jgi:hypothetical protein
MPIPSREVYNMIRKLWLYDGSREPLPPIGRAWPRYGNVPGVTGYCAYRLPMLGCITYLPEEDRVERVCIN